MTMNEYVTKDYLSEMRENVTEQFKDKDVIDRYIQLFVSQYTDLQQAFKDLMQLRSLDTATGVHLDNIGYIVGQPREIFNAATTPFFGFDGAPGARTFGDVTNSTLGGRWRSVEEPESGSRYLNDEEYRRVIRVKILNNVTKCTKENFIEAAWLLFDLNASYGSTVDIINHATIQLTLGRAVSSESLSPFPGLDEIELGRRYLPIPLGCILNIV